MITSAEMNTFFDQKNLTNFTQFLKSCENSSRLSFVQTFFLNEENSGPFYYIYHSGVKILDRNWLTTLNCVLK